MIWTAIVLLTQLPLTYLSQRLEMPNLNVDEQIVRRLNQAMTINNETFAVTASIGIALWPLNANTTTELFRKANEAMHLSKRQNKTYSIA